MKSHSIAGIFLQISASETIFQHRLQGQLDRERNISLKSFQTEVLSWTSARHVHAQMVVFPGFEGPDRSFWWNVRRDVRPKTSSLG